MSGARTSMTSQAAARRRRTLSANLVVLVALVAVGGLWAALAPASTAVESSVELPSRGTESLSFASTDYSPEQVEAGRDLFLTGCSSCHGLNAEGGANGPSLIGVGAASVDFQVGTGRMPLAQPGAQAARKPVKYTQEEIDLLSAYVASLAPGPGIPQVDITAGDLALGKDLFQNNCSQCHGSSGGGGALTYGKHAPALDQATAVHVAEAMVTGPGQMPVFGPSQFTQTDYDSIAAYVTGVAEEPNYGGNGLGRFGPVTEGIVVWVVAIGGLLGAVLLIGART